MSSFRRLLKLLAPHKRTVAIGLFSLIVTALADLVPPLVLRWLIDDAALATAVSDSTRILRVFLGVGILLAVHGTRCFFAYLRTNRMHILGERFILDLRKMVYSHLQTLSLSYFESHQTGEIMSRVTNDTEVVEEFVTHVADTLIADSLKLVVMTGILFYLLPELAVVALIPIPALVVVVFFFSRKMRKTYRWTRERLAQINAKLQDNLSGIRVIKSFTNEDYEHDRFSEESRNYYDMRVQAINLLSRFLPGVEILASVGSVAVIGTGVVFIIRGALSLGSFVAFMGYMMQFYQPVRSLSRVNDTIQRALAAADRIFELLDVQPEIRDEVGAKDMPPIEGRVQFDHVFFRYSDGEEVLTDINIDAQPGQIVALVGRSGAGKSSVINLIPRFYDPTKGHVLVDGIDVRTVKQESLRRQIALVLQDTFLFNGTIRENIAYGRLGATDDEIVEAAKAANAHEFIEVMPQSYDTEIGERGIKLSGGQRQRLAIARAILANPRILILDEATSSVDSESEYLIHRAMDRLMEGRTTFVIAHRLSTIKHANTIVTLDSGRIVEVGNHDSLISRDGAYSQMYEMYERTMEL